MREWAVDLYSDTKTRPSPAMREAMAAAMVGDEQQDEDPTVATLTDRVASLLGKETAVFLPSGTMANVIATLVHCRRGDEIFAEATSHVVHFETGGAAGLAGATTTTVPGDGGIFGAPALAAALREPRRNAPRPRLLWIEQTTNMGGGRIWPLGTLSDLRALAAEHRLAMHIDGARLLNAVVASGVDAAAYGALSDSLWVDFTKGLGAPFGAVLAGSSAFVEEARRYKHMLGGAMRQAGIMAAGCLFALDHNVSRLAEDHAHARLLADGLRAFPSLQVSEPETNIVLAKPDIVGLPASSLARHLAERDVRVGVFGGTLRLVTHLDIDRRGIGRALDAFHAVIGTTS